TFGFRLSYKALEDKAGPNIRQPASHALEADLTTLLKSSVDGQSQVYTQALQLLEGLKISPSCHRLAASTLIHSCQSIDGSASESEKSLEDMKSVYAAQLAICEVTDAGSPPPKSCDVFLPNDQNRMSRTMNQAFQQRDGLSKSLKAKLSSCLQSLESRPQHWTSYSNNRQNAVVMCQAARINVEKDEMIKLHKSMAGTASDANSALASATAVANEALVRQREFERQVRVFQEQLMQDLDVTKTEAQSYFDTLVEKVDSIIHEIMSQISRKMQDIDGDAQEVQKVLRSSAAKAGNLQANLGRVFQQAVEGSAELAASQTSLWDATSSSATELQNSLQDLKEQQVHTLVGALDNMHSQLMVTNSLVLGMHTRQQEMDQRLSNLDRSFTNLESTAVSLHALQTSDAEAQMHLHSRVQTELQIAQGLLADITASAATLQNTVHDTSSKVAHMVAFGTLTTKILNWGWTLVILFVIYHFHPKAAGYAAVALGKSSYPSKVSQGA
ncbi:MAG: hypothetical protein Q9174_005696, partial [Haloplaca sp. 1 TL-2023]